MKKLTATLFTLASLAITSTTLTDQIPTKELFCQPTVSKIKLSPDGTKISYTKQSEKIKNLWIKAIGSGQEHQITDLIENGINDYVWHFNGKSILYLRSEDKKNHLFIKNLVTQEEKNLTKSHDLDVKAIFSYKENAPNEILVTTKEQDRSQFLLDLYKINVKTGQATHIGENDGTIYDWFVDENNTVQATKKLNQEGFFELFMHDRLDAQLEREGNPVGFSADGKTFYSIDSRDSNTRTLKTIDVVSGKTKTLLENKKYDIDYIILNPKTKKLEAAVLFAYHKEWICFDKQFEKDLHLAQNLDYGDISLCSRSADDTKWLVSFGKDNGPTSFWFFDRNSKKGTFLFVDRPSLIEYKFAHTEPMKFSARDGMEIEGYITYPKNGLRENVPFVLRVHGGPWARDIWGFYPEVQWLADRGCAVLQINFRGSKGYGKNLLFAGNKEWGKAMQDDLVDAVDWAITNKIADPKRVCIYGFSYGGYAAAMGAILTPEKFCCAVDISGPKNLYPKQLEFAKRFPHVTRVFADRVGSPETEKDLLDAVSPLLLAEKIQTPLFLTNGATDFRVKKEEMEEIVEVLKKNNIDYEHIFFEDEDHWVTKEKNKLDLYTSLNQFLKKHMKL